MFIDSATASNRSYSLSSISLTLSGSMALEMVVNPTTSEKNTETICFRMGGTFCPPRTACAVSGGKQRSHEASFEELGVLPSALARTQAAEQTSDAGVDWIRFATSSNVGRRQFFWFQQSTITLSIFAPHPSGTTGRFHPSRTPCRTSLSSSPSYGSRRDITSQIVIAKLYTSDEGSTTAPFRHSGAVQNGVPTAHLASLRFCDSPKSEMRAWNLSLTSTLDDLRSPWMMTGLLACRNAIPCAVPCSTCSTIPPSISTVSLRSRSHRLPRFMSSMTSRGSPLSTTAPMRGMMLGCRRFARMRISARKSCFRRARIFGFRSFGA
mmetsp:Transcript_16982/g.46501  ORF Transcript_16982/g.46501 Transcript_16982/m.46501 type:complete len:323 (-) Transcript_16982:1926-2894(-)